MQLACCVIAVGGTGSLGRTPTAIPKMQRPNRVGENKERAKWGMGVATARVDMVPSLDSHALHVSGCEKVTTHRARHHRNALQAGVVRRDVKA